jgi:hypothetical protein
MTTKYADSTKKRGGSVYPSDRPELMILGIPRIHFCRLKLVKGSKLGIKNDHEVRG